MTEEKEVANGEEGEEVEIKEMEVFEVYQTLLCYTRAPSHYQQSLQSNRLNHTSFL